MITNLGKFLRILRINNGEILKNMSEKLGVSSSFLSAIENGKKNMPEKMKNDIIKIYSLDEAQINELEDAMIDSATKIDLQLFGQSDSKRELAISFSRTFESLDDDTAEKIMKMLESADRGD